ncbi:ABC transporter ATP-binding protein [Rhodococcus sp. ACS1]|uniref:ABC transporter ATP-binding protein n=1 Tax=Rhodococcus sp. ACS1 TaxID=2028570 RepID=UPI000BB16644|nr:ABC transporter ATP-binding protein [Rhodococcus sp. ACS1]PBC35625.1 ABC transporter ATP-binding protein [Rhodococcus sp. ACS1]
MHTSDALLALDNLSVTYGHVRAVDGVSLTVGHGEVVALLGANGAGKSSLLRAISGTGGERNGSVLLQGESLLDGARYRVARRGVAHAMEGRRIIGPLTVADNLLLAAHASQRNERRAVPGRLDEVFSYFPKLYERRAQHAGLLSGGEQQMLAIGRAIVSRPDLLLLDEPSMGLAPIVIEEIYELLRSREGTLASCGILLSEQSAALALGVSERAYVLARGRIVFDGRADELDKEKVAAAYLNN